LQDLRKAQNVFATFYSLVATCKLNGINPYEYFVDIVPILNGYPAKISLTLYLSNGIKIAPADQPGNMRWPNGYEYTNGTKCNLCDDEDLLMVWDGARCGLIGKAKKGAVGSTLMKILPKENIHKEYLYHFISSKFTTLNTKPKGVGIPHIEPTLLWNFELVVPPLPEQKAIVAKIEELLSDLENGKWQLQTAQQQLKIYKQSLLKAAFEGKLTEAWRKIVWIRIKRIK